MNTAATMRALRVRPSIAHARLASRPFQHPTRSATIAANEAATNVRSAGTRTKNLVYGSLLSVGLSFGYLYGTDTRSSIHEWLVVPALRQIYPDGEDAHHAGTRILAALHRFGLNPRERGDADTKGDLAVEVFGHTLANPVGTSAGIDKGAEIPTPLFELGPAIVEVGAITLRPQDGNPKPRVFRLPSQNALINRYGFNSEGAEAVALRLRQRVREFAYHAGLGLGAAAEQAVLNGDANVPPGSLKQGRLLAVQVAKNKTTPETDIDAVVHDYASAVAHVGPYADILVVNVSSPNTPGLRTLQNTEPLTRLLTGVVAAVHALPRKTKPAVMVKVSPDEDSPAQVSGIVDAVWASGVDGVIVGNTTNRRPDPLPAGYALPPAEAKLLLEQGGYSGPQLFERTRALVARYRRALDAGPARPSPESPSSESPSSATPTPHAAPAPADADPTAFDDLSTSAPSSTSLSPASPAPSTPGPRKVIFATGGITTGAQARAVLDAGASVVQVYTAMIYGGAGTVSRIKRELREEKLKEKTGERGDVEGRTAP
ncbi:hypothetical protein C7974DRAFT_370276 [Boeremia exigua]|uniref:uncharacterized protein n=1 Tax=Boeremia exigua TaxID=749465 RepID=UPI001E8ECADE|nr:uncharacterized protein C7974DRAFT_370276 [Boeremia exigua]KAH6611986.1 hypothetical protein C7974DRAFT_370276 [Boeremia exigua]